MALNYDFSKVENCKKKLRSKRNELVLNSLIFATMAVGIRKITEKNYKTFYARLTAVEHLLGAYLIKGEKCVPAYITLDEVKSFIGLVTNANELTASQFESFLRKAGA